MTKPTHKKSPSSPATSASLFLPSPQELPQVSASLPTSPGVYWFLDSDKKILYVGKSVNLKNRLLSYSRINQIYSKTTSMVQLANFTSYTKTDSELEALLLEAELIRMYQPEFNIRLKDSKSNIYITISKQTFPTISLKRKQEIKSIKSPNIFGPYQSTRQIKKVLKMIRPIFKWCQHPEQGKPCFYYHLDQCSGACFGQISTNEYQQNINQLKQFLRGSYRDLEKEIKSQIEYHSQREQFEAANQLKQKYHLIQQVIASYKFNKSFKVLPNLSKNNVNQQLIHAKQLILTYLPLTNDFSLDRVEGYDISHFQADYLVGSMVVFNKGSKDASQYRRFKIKDKASVGDPQQIAEIVSRRFTHPEWPFPNCILIDGSKPQIKAAIKASQTSIPIIGLAKKPDRLVFPQIINNKFSWKYHTLIPDHPATIFFTSIRNESHRFANSYQQTLHKKALTPK